MLVPGVLVSESRICPVYFGFVASATLRYPIPAVRPSAPAGNSCPNGR